MHPSRVFTGRRRNRFTRCRRTAAALAAALLAQLAAAAAVHAGTPATAARLLFDGLTVGIVTGLGVYHLALYFFVRETGYLRFACYSLAAGLYVLSIKNHFLRVLWPAFPAADSALSWCLLMLTIQGFIRFTQGFLQTARTLPGAHRILGGIDNLLYAGPLVGAPLVGFGFRSTGFAFNSTLALVTFAVVIATAQKCHRAGFIPARAYLTGNLFFCAGGAVYGLSFLGLVPAHPFYADVVVTGIVFQAIFFSLGVAERMARMAADLSRQALEGERFKQRMMAVQNSLLEARIRERTAELCAEKDAAERLLHNILPIGVARELRQKGAAVPRRHDAATIVFTDFEGFTTTVGTIPARKLVDELNHIFSAFDTIVAAHGIEKIKTVGDAYLAAGGLPHDRPDHATACVAAAMAMLSFIDAKNCDSAIKWRMRVGIHSGAVVAGVVGRHKFTYDIWGDTVNIAARMESAAEAGRINVSAYTYDLIRRDIACEYRGKIAVKGKGKIDMYHVLGHRQPATRAGRANAAATRPAGGIAVRS